MVSVFQKWWFRHGKSPKKFEDVELQALFDEDDSQTQKQLTKRVNTEVLVNKLFPIG